MSRPPRAHWGLFAVAAVLGWILPTVGYTLLVIVVIEGLRWIVRHANHRNDSA